MITTAKRAARAVLGIPPVLGLLRSWRLRGNPVTVLCYHTIGPDTGGPDAWTVLRAADFRAHLAALQESHDIVDLDRALADGPGHRGRPRAVLTFDDGEAGNHRYLLPILTELQLPVTIFVATGQIETGQPYWFDRIMGALTAGADVDLATHGLGRWHIPPTPGPSRWATVSSLLETLKRTAPDCRAAIVDDILSRYPLPPGRPPLGPMTRAELAEIARSPRVTIGAHSHCHNLLDQLPLVEAEASIARSRSLLRDWTGQEVAHFAWPNGNHTPALRQRAQRLGFRSAAALDMRLWRAGADPYALPRLGIGRHDDTARLRLRLVGT
ncbi:polysaccharide deacetylase family protein [Tabrizicola sp. BL-A-41-H6]|uniref:polysaccharide deacetylase family protein n=1 Tax=Tabrizicola sp. BL-A-41-H6 TaxID=3421107 RepID=UPI003D67E69A